MSRAARILLRVIHDLCNTDPVQVAQEGKATIHSLRDTYASRMVQNNMSLLKVSKLLGHPSPTMTRKYAHLVDEDVADEALKILDGG